MVYEETWSNIDDTHRLLDGFLKVRTDKSFQKLPLQASNSINRTVPHHNIHLTALKVVTSYLNKKEKTDLSQKKIFSKALRCLEATTSQPEQLLLLAKSSQKFVIDLIDASEIYMAFSELNNVAGLLSRILGTQVNDDGCIPFVEMDASFELIVTNLVVSYHFLYLQCLLMGCGKYLKSILSETCQFILFSQFVDVPSYFLHEKPVGAWLAQAHKTRPQNFNKHLHNISKLLTGFCKIYTNALAVPETIASRDTIRQSLTSLRVKIIDSTIQLNPAADVSLPPPTDLIEPFTLDLKSTLRKFQRADLLVQINELVRTYDSPNEQSLSLLKNQKHDVSQLRMPLMSIGHFNTLIKTKYAAEVDDYMLAATLHGNDATHFKLLDRIMAYLKECIDASTCNKYVFETCVSRMYSVFKNNGQLKRIRNLSNLIFNYGNRDNSYSRNYWTDSINLEMYIVQTQMENDTHVDLSFLRSKCDRIIESLIQAGLYKTTVFFFKLVFDTINTGQFLESLDSYSIPVTMKQLEVMACKDHGSFVSLLEALDEKRAVAVVVSMFRQSSSSWNAPTLAPIVNFILNCLLSLKLYCYYEMLKTTAKFSVPEVIEFNPSNLEILLLAGVYSFQNDFTALGYINTYFQSFEPVDNIPLERDVVRHLISNLQLSGLYEHAMTVIETYRQRQMTDEKDLKSLKWLFDINMSLCSCQLRSRRGDLHQTISDSMQILKNISSKDPREAKPSDVVRLKFFQAGLDIRNSSLQSALKRYEATLTFMKSKSEFTLNDSRSGYMERLNNLFTLACISNLSGDLEVKLARFLLAINKYRLAVKLLLSISKKLDSIQNADANSLRSEVQEALSIALIETVKVQNVLGVSREQRYFLDELQSLTSRVHSQGRKIINTQELAVFSALHDDTEEMDAAVKSTSYLFAKSEDYKSVFSATFSSCISLSRLRDKVNLEESTLSSSEQLNLESAFFSTLLGHKVSSWTSSETERSSLKSLLQCDIRLSSVKHSLESIPLYANLSETPISLPSFAGLELIFKNQLRGVRGFETSRAQLIEKLVHVCEDVMKLFIEEDFATYEFHFLRFTLTSCFLLLNAITHVQKDIESRMREVLQQIYYVSDILRSRYIASERLAYKYKTENGHSILPCSIQHTNSEGLSLTERSRSFFETLTRELPHNWTVVTIDKDPESDSLLVSRISQKAEPTFIRLPLLRRCGQSTGTFEQTIADLKSIVSASNLSTQAQTTAQIKTKEDRKKWWASRFALDLQFERILDTVNDTWIGGFSGIFGAEIDEYVLDEFRAVFVNAWKGILPKKVERLANSFQYFDDGILRLFLTLCGPNCFSEFGYHDSMKESMMDMAQYVLNTLAHAGEDIPFDKIDMDKCVQVLLDAVAKFSLKHLWSLEHTVIVPSKECEIFPWESLSCLRSKSVSRVQSVQQLLELLVSHRNNQKAVTEPLKIGYLVNPGGDLVRTEKNFSSLFQQNPMCDGITGSAPNSEFFQSKVLGKDIYIYLGHGGSEEYISVSDLLNAYNTGEKVPPSLLVGCSSAALTQCGYLESHGNVYNWMTAGSPMVMVNLWDVTDKDIDKFSMSVFDQWGLLDATNKHKNICEAVSASRGVCTLRNLNGSAPVVYGLPLTVNQL